MSLTMQCLTGHGLTSQVIPLPQSCTISPPFQPWGTHQSRPAHPGPHPIPLLCPMPIGCSSGSLPTVGDKAIHLGHDTAGRCHESIEGLVEVFPSLLIMTRAIASGCNLQGP